MRPARWRAKWLVAGVIAAAALAGGVWLFFSDAVEDQLPAPLQRLFQSNHLPGWLTVGNGRLEATEIDVATKLAGRLAEVVPREGDIVEAGAVVARLDTATLEAQLRQAEAELKRAQRETEYALAIVEQRRSERDYADLELRRQVELEQRNFAALDRVDQARTGARTAAAALRAAEVKVAETGAAIEAARAQIDRIQADIEDSALKAPRRGRVLYRMAEPGEVLAAGGKVLTLLDLTDVYMVFFLPGTVAGRITMDGEVRLILDAGPEYVVPARVSFVASRAQFTPKQVETRSEREKLVFRVKARIDRELLGRYEPLVKTGLPGVAYVRLDSTQPWPHWLQPKLPPWPERTNGPTAEPTASSLD
jgi:HlyD family secretion protein